jgi:hypothetical protein
MKEFITANVPQFIEFENRVSMLDRETTKRALKAVSALKIKLDQEDGCLYADVEITKAYLQKMQAVYQGIVDHAMFSEINNEIRMYANTHDYLISDHLNNVLNIAAFDPVEEYKDISGLTAKELADYSGIGSSRIRQIAAEIPGGKKTEKGWIFPFTAVEYVKNLPGRGRPSKKTEGHGSGPE